jgi:hypothetical protein
VAETEFLLKEPRETDPILARWFVRKSLPGEQLLNEDQPHPPTIRTTERKSVKRREG